MLDERTLVHRCQMGDERALAEVVDRHKEMVASVMYRMTGDDEVTRDLTQETFLQVFRGIGKFRGDAKLSTWIFRVAHRLCLRELERRQRGAGYVRWDDVEEVWRPGRKWSPNASGSACRGVCRPSGSDRARMSRAANERSAPIKEQLAGTKM